LLRKVYLSSFCIFLQCIAGEVDLNSNMFEFNKVIYSLDENGGP